MKTEKLELVGKHLWRGKVFYRDERVLRNRIDDTTLLKPLIDGDLSTIQKITVNGKDQWLLFPARLYCGQSLLDSRRESVIIDYFYTDEIAGYRERPDYLAGRRGLQVRDEIRMVRPGFYLGRAYLGKIFLLNFSLYNKEIASRDGDAFVKTGRSQGRLLAGDAATADLHRGEVTLPGTRHDEARLFRRSSRCARSFLRLADARERPAWAIDPAVPGSVLPSAGRSLFDFVTAGGVPFPFEALVRKMEAAAGCAPGKCVKQVLIPLGRSLQRTAAAPDFFVFPRVVVAVTGEGTGPMFARDRIYLGYQEHANLIEVISYNEAAARFEFQLVRDYRAGATPQVVYANRAVCTACHQNHAPIFSRPVWDETNANPTIAARLSAARKQLLRHSGAARRGHPQRDRRCYRSRQPHRRDATRLARGVRRSMPSDGRDAQRCSIASRASAGSSPDAGGRACTRFRGALAGRACDSEP